MKENRREQAIDTAGDMLQRISEIKMIIAKMQDAYEAEVQQIRQKYEADTAGKRAELQRLEAQIELFCSENKQLIFNEGPDSRVDLSAGSLLYVIQTRAKQVRAMKHTLEQLGRDDLIKTAKTVNWDAVNKLSNEELHALGTYRIELEIFNYELKS